MKTMRTQRLSGTRLVARACGRSALGLAFALGLVLAGNAQGQDRLKTMPGYERYQKVSKEIPDSVTLGSVPVTWQDGGKALEFQREGKRHRYDLAARTLSVVTNPPPAPVRRPSTNAPPGSRTNLAGGITNAPTTPPRSRRPGRDFSARLERPDRGRQYTNYVSPDGQWRAFYSDANVWLAATNDASGTNFIAVTKEGSLKSRIKYGTANWVYGEELEQTTAMWWHSNSTLLAFYRFDESQVQDYFLTLANTRIQDRLDVEPYMKAGATNPVVDLLIYHRETQRTVTVDVRSGEPFSNSSIGHYVYGISWTPDGRELLFHRTNRRQNIMELCAADPATGKVRVVIREEWLPSWTENSPTMRFLKDGQRFIWSSERTGWKNFYLYDLSGTLLSTLTACPFEVDAIERVDEIAGLLYFMARSGDNPMKLQLHRVSLDGHGNQRLTDPAFHHTVDLAPDGQHFVDIAQTHDQPPTTTLRDADGGFVAELARSDLTKFKRLGLKTAELLQFKAADGTTDLYGLLQFPSNFKPSRKYPLLVSVYAGPATTGARETFVMPSSLAEFGFLVASFDSRSASGRGKRFLDAIYQRLGIAEIDDQAAGVKSLHSRRYVDAGRVGIHGTSYGGTASALALLRYPEVFQAACANSAVLDFRNYDSIYTERYMWIPQEAAAAYDAGNPMNYVTNLHGRLMIFFGTADNNVHPANSLQFIQAMQRAGKSFEVQIGPDVGHAAVNRDRMMEFFIQNLVLTPPARYLPPAAPKQSKHHYSDLPK
jgi:dipeptidyl-peptidase-4